MESLISDTFEIFRSTIALFEGIKRLIKWLIDVVLIEETQKV